MPIFLTSRKVNVVSPISTIKEKPLDTYTFERLRNQTFDISDIALESVLQENNDIVSNVFFFIVDNKKVSGVMHVPKKEGVYPVIVLFRGYIDQKVYKIGDGTRRVAQMLAKNGFITLAPDFLGYGQSASASANPIEDRLQTYTTSLTLLHSLDTLNSALKKNKTSITADTKKVGIWGHSNGGQIALSALAISGKSYPTVVWAPVTKPFPYSVLYYTDEFDDQGKLLRKIIADFEKDYDVEKYTFVNYLDWITASIQLHQGGGDDEVPKRWSDEFVQVMEEHEKDVEYFTYPGDDHNFTKGGFEAAVTRSILFYKEKLSE